VVIVIYILSFLVGIVALAAVVGIAYLIGRWVGRMIGMPIIDSVDHVLYGIAGLLVSALICLFGVAAYGLVQWLISLVWG
jgi:hypothetical protein